MKIFFSIPKKYFSFYTNFFFYFSSVDFLNQNGFFFYPKSKLINYKLINNNFRVIYDNFSKKTFSKKVVYSFKKFLLTFKYIYKISFYINLVIKPKYRRSYPFVLTGSFYRYFQNTLKNLKFFIKNILRDGLKRIWIEKNYKSLEFFHIYNAFKKGLVLKFIQSKKSIIYYFNSYKNFYKNFYMNNILSKKFLFFEKRRRQKAIFKFFFENKLLKLFKNNEEEGKVLKKIFDRNLLEFSKRENFFNKTSFLLKKSQFLKKFTGGLQKSFIKKEIIFNKTFLKKVLLKKFSQLKEFFQIKNLYVKKKKKLFIKIYNKSFKKLLFFYNQMDFIKTYKKSIFYSNNFFYKNYLYIKNFFSYVFLGVANNLEPLSGDNCFSLFFFKPFIEKNFINRNLFSVFKKFLNFNPLNFLKALNFKKKITPYLNNINLYYLNKGVFFFLNKGLFSFFSNELVKKIFLTFQEDRKNIKKNKFFLKKYNKFFSLDYNKKNIFLRKSRLFFLFKKNLKFLYSKKIKFSEDYKINKLNKLDNSLNYGSFNSQFYIDMYFSYFLI